jgi:molybdopterin-guanine dinucleotide biosynthesis protein A
MRPLTIRHAQPDCGAVILSGGLNSRMGGANKAFLEVGGHSILSRLLTGLTPFFEEILLVTREPQRYADMPVKVKVVADLYGDRSSLTGIHAGLVHARADFAFVVPCDTPFLQPAVIQILLEALQPQVDVVVPLVETHYEPLCAIYSKRCLPAIEEQLDRGDYRIFNFFHQMRVKTLSTDEIKTVDPELRSFFNVNTPAALRASQKMTRLQEDDASSFGRRASKNEAS